MTKATINELIQHALFYGSLKPTTLLEYLTDMGHDKKAIQIEMQLCLERKLIGLDQDMKVFWSYTP